MKKLSVVTFILIISLLMAASCDYGDAPSLYDEDFQGNPDPVITSVEPPNMALAGIGYITITGQNFSSTTEHNRIYFNDKKGVVLEASQTQLRVRPPVLRGEDIRLRVSVAGAVEFSNTYMYELQLAVEEAWGGLSDAQTPWGIAIDNEGNLYVSIEGLGEFGGVKKITPDQEQSDYASRQAWIYPYMKMGPDGSLYMARGPATFPAIYSVAPGGGTASPWLLGSGLGRIRDLDFDEHGNIWAGGNNNPAIYRITPDKEVEAFPFEHSDVRSIRVFDGAVYVAAVNDDAHNIWKFPFTEPGIAGDPELYFAFSDQYGHADAGAFAITFSSAGEMFVGTDGPDALIIVYPDKSWEPFYPGTLFPKNMAMAWGDGPNLFMTREAFGDNAQKIIRVNTQKESAPYYGLQ